jgi:hypothetical protein
MWACSSTPSSGRERKKDAGIKPIDYPAFAFGSEEMRNGIDNDTLYIPDWGIPMSLSHFPYLPSAWRNRQSLKWWAKIKTGPSGGGPGGRDSPVGGSSPNSLAATDQYVFVSNGNNDNISVISLDHDSVVHTIFLKPDDRIRQFRGGHPLRHGPEPGSQTVVCGRIGDQCRCRDPCGGFQGPGAYTHRVVPIQIGS